MQKPPFSAAAAVGDGFPMECCEGVRGAGRASRECIGTLTVWLLTALSAVALSYDAPSPSCHPHETGPRGRLLQQYRPLTVSEIAVDLK